MNPVVFPEADSLKIGGTNPATGDLAVTRGVLPDGLACIVSCFEVTDDAELAEIVRTRRVWLLIRGEAQPAVALTGLRPFDESGHFDYE